MRRISKVFRQRQMTRQHPKDHGTIKSIERQRGTGSIGPDSGSQVNADTGFTATDIAHDDFDALQVGDRVQYNAVPDPSRPGYADATAVESEPSDEAEDILEPREGPADLSDSEPAIMA